MEGIMMRGPHKTVMCVRRANGTIVTESVPQKPKTFINKIPIIRGVVGFVESMTTGTKTLMRSAEIAIEDAENEEAAAALKAANAEGAAESGETIAESAASDAESAAPVAESAASVAESAASVAESAETVAESAAPVAEFAASVAESAETVAESAETVAESAAPVAPVVESAASVAESAESDAESGKPDVECSAPVETVANAANTAPSPAVPAKKSGKGKKNDKSDKKKSNDSESGFLVFISTLIGFGLAILLFFYAPTYAASGILNGLLPWLMPDRAEYFAADAAQNVWRPIIEGVIKLIIFVIYIALCSCMKEIRTLFSYHGAEHKTIFCYEAGEELTVENVRKFKRFHPRCGTSFLILMMLVGIACGIAVKFLLPPDIANNNLYYPLIKLALIPLIMGIGYEVLKACGKHDNVLTRIISAPGMWMQRLTTKEPTDDMIECAIAALKPVIPENGEDMQ